MLKSSDLANKRINEPLKWMIVTQKNIGDDTETIRKNAPKTWAYLCNHGSFFDKRKSSIYKNKPRFSIFGVGDYSFSTWKVAISGLYKQLKFVSIGMFQNKPIVLDDTCYFIPCESESEAKMIVNILNSTIAKEFFEAFIFWDKKRPITVSILSKLSIEKLADEIGVLLPQ